MRNEKSLVVIGASDEETAHLRLLIRKAAPQLAQRWRWGTESGADLIVVDVGQFAGQMARTRALSTGVRCAVLTDDAGAGTVEGPELFLHRPLKVENVVAVLNRVAGGNVGAPEMANIENGFYFHDNDADDFTLEDEETGFLTPRQSNAEPVARGLDEIHKRDAASEQPRFRVPMNLTEETLVEGVTGPSERSEARMSDRHDALGRTPSTPGPNTLPPVKRGAVVDTTRHPFRAYLDEGMLGGPSQATIDGAPALTLDPKHQSYYSDSGLSAIEPYLRENLPRSAWRALTGAEFAQIRDTCTALPYSRLRWLDAFLQADGRLSPQLDPGGTYRLTRWLEIESEYHHHAAIANALTSPARLNEIASSTGAPMSEVFAVVSAYHAIGLVEWEPRASLRHTSKDATETKSGLLGRLTRPFGRK